jgi:hypothetical protein
MQQEDKISIIEVKQFRGMNLVDDPIAIDPSESPYMMNMDITKNGAVTCRFGYEEVLDLTTEDADVSGRCYGLFPYYNTTGTDVGDYLLVFAKNVVGDDTELYYVKDNDFTNPTGLGDVAAINRKMQGTTHLNTFVFGHANVLPQTFDGAALGTTTISIDVSYFSVFQSRLFGVEAESSNLYYSETETLDTDFNTNAIVVSDGDGTVATTIIPNLDFLQVYKQDSIHGVNWSFDDTYAVTAPVLQPIVSWQGGAMASGSVQAVYGYSYFLSRMGFQAYGASPERVTANIPLPLSLVIEPLVKQINFNAAEEITSVFFDSKYMCAAPVGTGQTTNNAVFAFNENIKRRFGIDNWVVYNNIPVSDFAIYRNADKQDRLYFASAFESKVYRFNTSYSDAGFGYERIWRSKTFQQGERTEFCYLDLEGKKTLGSTIYVDIWTDGITYTEEITDDNMVNQGISDGYLGDGYTGAFYTGEGNTAGTDYPLYKWRKRVRFPGSVNMGYNMYFQIRNVANNEGWQLNRYRLAFKQMPDDPNYPYAD